MRHHLTSCPPHAGADRRGAQPEPGNRWTLNFGPQHPATHTTLRLVLELDGERILRATPHIGYLHSGFEKLGEHLNYNQYVTIVDRMDYSAPIYNELAWHGAAEKLMGIELTPRCKVLRTIAGELGRIQSHLLCVGAAGLDLGAFTAFLYGFNEREDDLRHRRVHVRPALPHLLDARRRAEHGPARRSRLQADGQEVHRRPAAQGDGRRREAAEQEPHLRRPHQGRRRRHPRGGDRLEPERPDGPRSGVRRDIRKDEPYLCFADNWDGQGAKAVDFKVPVMTTGDVYARYLVRLEEMKQIDRTSSTN